MQPARNIIFINSHPIQYFAPLYRFLNDQGLSTTCWYCSDENVQGHLDRQFGIRVEWDIPILEGYPHRFFRNYSWKPSLYNGFFGLINTGMIRSLFREPKSIVVVHGWAYLTHVLVLIFARIAGHTVCIRGENPLNQELLKSRWILMAKRILLQGFLFRFVHHFLYIGYQNKAFYHYYGVQEGKLIFTPYAVDNERFQKAAEKLIPLKKQIRAQLSLPINSKIILFTAKFIKKKRPFDLLKAYEMLELNDKCLVMVGDGELRNQMEQYVRERNISSVFLTGFVNQSEIVKYYTIADVFVMCSGVGETWGLSVNEAMNFALPVVVSDISGCSADLAGGKSGFIFTTGDIKDLEDKIKLAFQMKSNLNHRYLKDYSYNSIAGALQSI